VRTLQYSQYELTVIPTTTARAHNTSRAELQVSRLIIISRPNSRTHRSDVPACVPACVFDHENSGALLVPVPVVRTVSIVCVVSSFILLVDAAVILVVLRDKILSLPGIRLSSRTVLYSLTSSRPSQTLPLLVSLLCCIIDRLHKDPSERRRLPAVIPNNAEVKPQTNERTNERKKE
jgi:hypothetical protein